LSNDARKRAAGRLAPAAMRLVDRGELAREVLDGLLSAAPDLRPRFGGASPEARKRLDALVGRLADALAPDGGGGTVDHVVAVYAQHLLELAMPEVLVRLSLEHDRMFTY
jgi:hypothetical protein